MTLIKRRKRQKSFTVFLHAQISCHHYTMSEDDDIVMMPWNFSMQKYSKRIFAVFYVQLVSSLH